MRTGRRRRWAFGKIVFWSTWGERERYQGRYAGSTGVRASTLATEFAAPPGQT